MSNCVISYRYIDRVSRTRMDDLHIQVGRARPEDVAAILTISRSVGVFNNEEIAAVDELLHAYLEQGPESSGYIFVSCRDDGRVVGFACYGPRPLTSGTFDLYWIATDKAWQGHGVGTALLKYVAEEVRTLGGRLIVVETSGTPAYAPTRRFYETHGYKRAATIADFYAPGDDLVVYVQQLR